MRNQDLPPDEPSPELTASPLDSNLRSPSSLLSFKSPGRQMISYEKLRSHTGANELEQEMINGLSTCRFHQICATFGQ